jgi:hypothetical protein
MIKPIKIYIHEDNEDFEALSIFFGFKMEYMEWERIL